MFRVTLRWDDVETSTSFFKYEYALREMNFLIKESEKMRMRDNGFIKEYSVELKRES